MKKRSLISLVAVGLACNMLFSSCIGSFGLFNKLLDWNRSLDSKLVNELVFVAFCIVPVYGIAYAADILVLNSIEFWSGTNPVADVGTVKNIETDKGLYAVETKENGYQIQKEGEEAIDLVYNQENKTWSVEANGESTDLLRFESDDEVVMFLPDGTEMPVELNQAGVLAFKQAVEQSTYYAAR